MKKTLFKALAAALLPGAAAAAPAAPADSIVSAEIVDYKDSTYYNTLLENAPGLANTPDVPRFAIMGKERRFYLGIGATIMAVANYDFGHVIDNPNSFAPKLIPIDTDPGNGGAFRLTAQNSQVYLNVVALPGTKNQLGAFVSFKLMGHDYSPTLDHAYLRYRGIIAGRTFSAFTDQSVCPPAIDAAGPNASTTVVHPMISYEPYFGRNHQWRVGIGIDQPNESYTLSTGTAHVRQRTPDIPFYVQRSWKDGTGWVRLSGILRNMYYRDVIEGKNHDVLGWGVKATGRVPVYGGLQASGMAVYGKGIASYIQDLTGQGMDLTPDPSNAGRLNPVKVWGAFGSLQYDFSPKCFATATYSMVRTYARHFGDSSTDAWPQAYRYGQYVVANVFYNVNSIVQLGLEYDYGRRMDYDGRQAHDSRIQAMLKVSF